jgi:hypothetical protein
MRKRLEPALAAGAPFRYSAKELLGLAYVRANDHANAQKLFLELSFDPETPPGLRNRAQRLQSFLFGNVPSAAPATQ